MRQIAIALCSWLALLYTTRAVLLVQAGHLGSGLWVCGVIAAVCVFLALRLRPLQAGAWRLAVLGVVGGACVNGYLLWRALFAGAQFWEAQSVISLLSLVGWLALGALVLSPAGRHYFLSKKE